MIGRSSFPWLLILDGGGSFGLAISISVSYIVYLGAHSHGSKPLVADLHRATNSHYDLLGSLLGSKEKAENAIFYSYNRHINAFAAILDEKEAAEIASHPDVISVLPNNIAKLHTTQSWNFLGLETDGLVPNDSIWNKARFGEDVIIGNIDSGVWPESKSFRDDGFGPIPSKWRGICQVGMHDDVKCNRKLIGVRYFNKGFFAKINNDNRTLNPKFNTARDHDGHGSHTLSTAGGNLVPGVSYLGLGKGSAAGGSPKSRVAAYKVCWDEKRPTFQSWCTEADILAAFDAAINDGVDIISISMGHANVSDHFKSVVAIGGFHAVMNGILVVAAGGNTGPQKGTIQNTEPWTFTVGASTNDREFPSFAVLGNKKKFKGQSLSKALPSNKLYPLISGKEAKFSNASDIDGLLCKPRTLDANKVNGKILVCLLDKQIDMFVNGMHAALVGAVGMILANANNTEEDAIYANPHVLPATHINFRDGESVLAYINSTKSPMAYITPPVTLLDTKPAPVIASFSSRGPSVITTEILKPDIIAPGVNILAANPEDDGEGSQSIPYRLQSGTSMACPHVAGIAGLIKTLHPDWSPAAIRSAIMTTATTTANDMKPILTSFNLKATPFDYGAGHMSPNRAMDPGLVYDLNTNDYMNFLCAIGYNKSQFNNFTASPYTCPNSFSLRDFNYPSIMVLNLSGSVIVTRTVKNVGPPGTYYASVEAPNGISVLVEPNSLKFEKIGEEQKFKLILKAEGSGAAKDYVFGGLIWSDGQHYVKSPIVVKAA